MDKAVAFCAETEWVFPALLAAFQVIVEVGQSLMGREKVSVHQRFRFIVRVAMPITFKTIGAIIVPEPLKEPIGRLLISYSSPLIKA